MTMLKARLATTTAKTGANDNSNGATGNKVDDDGGGLTGDNDNDDGDGVTGYNDADDGNGRQRRRQ